MNLFLILFISISYKNFTFEFQWPDSVIQKIKNDEEPHQILIFTNESNSTYTHQEELLHQKLIMKIPTASIDLDKNRTSVQEFMPLFKNPRDVILYIVLYKATAGSDVYQKIQYFIHFWNQLTPVHRRPKYLIIIFNKYLKLECIYMSTLRYAWINKYLDITIMEVVFKSEVEIFLYKYNPFNDNFLQEVWSPKIGIFSDKMNNMYKYPIDTILYQIPPHLNFTENEEGALEVSGIHFQLLKFMSETLNFSINAHIKLNSERDRLMYILLKRIQVALLTMVNL